ncbi:map/microtubule affinity-regulating kinase [Anaeramoeba flamelloides]|uniref:Map/microtubule affinity-regulating kinase n=1 Tax=Anaeramoeba flamelloides TaxID=1746091 RepID=A0AAV7YG91_9EUKA|nr:map/microtubule affinity-regulating kinase [Anaeramoeba flamelloides]
MKNSIHIPNYTIGKHLKSTTKWKIYNAQHNLTHHTAKVIVVHKLYTYLNDNVEQFLTQVDQIKSFDHPNYLKFLQIHEDSKRYYLITDSFEGVTLKEFVNTKGKVKSKKQLNKILFQLISIIQYFHSKKFYHGFINPELILINENLEIKLKTFGFLFSENKKVTSTGINNNFSLPFTNKNISQQFLAPELTTLEPRISKKTDIWSLGLCTLFMILDQKRFNNLFKGHIKYQKFNKVKIPKWVGKNLKVLIKQMVQINFQKRVWFHDQQFLQFGNGLKSVSIVKGNNKNTNKQDDNGIAKKSYGLKTISRNGLQSKLNKKNRSKSLMAENDDLYNSISCFMNQGQSLISHEKRSVINQNNKIQTHFNYNLGSNEEEKDTYEYNLYKNGLGLDITSNEEIIFQNNYNKLNENANSQNNNVNEIKICHNANFSSDVKDCAKKSIKTEKKNNQQALYQMLQNLENTKNSRNLRNKTQNNKTNPKNRNNKISPNKKMNFQRNNSKSKTDKKNSCNNKDQSIIKKKEKISSKGFTTQNKLPNRSLPIMENIQIKHKVYINNVLSYEKDKLGKKFSPRQLRRIKKRNAHIKNKNSATNRGNFNTYSNKKMGLRESSKSMEKFQLKREQNLKPRHNLSNSNNPISHQYSKSVDYTRMLSNSSLNYDQKCISENTDENFITSDINEILNSSISHKKRKQLEKGYLKALQKLGIFYTKAKKHTYLCSAHFRDSILNFKISFVNIPKHKRLSRVNFVRLNCNLWDFYTLLQEIDKCLQLY